MKDWTEKHIRGLLHEKKIAGFTAPRRHKNYSGDKAVSIPRDKSKALIWLEWNLTYWGNQRALLLVREHKFSDRGFKFDFCFPAIMVAVEFEGGLFMDKGGHTSVNGISRDIEKYNLAATLGWRVIRVSAQNYQTVLRTLNDLVK